LKKFTERCSGGLKKVTGRTATAATVRIPYDGISNWTATVASAARPGCEGFLFDIVAALRKECELKPESLRESIDRLLPWRGWASWRRGNRE
jgi:hypothetical protein